MPNNNGFSYSKGTDKTNMTQEIKNNLEESSNNFLSNIMDSASTNLKKNINDVSLVDVAVKTPKGVAIEVGLKTLKDTANDVLNSFSKEDVYLDKLVKDYEFKKEVSEKDQQDSLDKLLKTYEIHQIKTTETSKEYLQKNEEEVNKTVETKSDENIAKKSNVRRNR